MRHIFRQEKYVKSKCGFKKKKTPLNPRSGCAFPYFSGQLRCIRHTHVDKRLKRKNMERHLYRSNPVPIFGDADLPSMAEPTGSEGLKFFDGPNRC